jgi:hypothetical protein
MSQENVEVVKEVYARGECGDFEGMLVLWHPWLNLSKTRACRAQAPTGVTPKIKRYIEGACRFWGQTRSEIDRFVDLGDHVPCSGTPDGHPARRPRYKPAV